MPHLAEHGFACYALSLRYHETQRGYMVFHGSRMRDYVEDVRRAAESLPQLPILVGHSMGGQVIMKYLERYPAAGAVLLSSIPVGGFLRGVLRVARLYLLRHIWDTFITLRRNPLRVSWQQFDHMCFQDDVPKTEVREWHSRLHLESFAALLDMILFDLPKPTRVTTPMLVLGAERDRIFTHQEIHTTAQAYRAHCEILPAVSHDIIRGIGWEQTAERIVQWLHKK